MYTVSEGIVSQEVCVRIFHPPISDRITDTINVAVQTVAGTASECISDECLNFDDC